MGSLQEEEEEGRGKEGIEWKREEKQQRAAEESAIADQKEKRNENFSSFSLFFPSFFPLPL